MCEFPGSEMKIVFKLSKNKYPYILKTVQVWKKLRVQKNLPENICNNL